MSTTVRLAVLGVCLAGMTGASPADEFPYKAYINREDVYVRSGPGEEYYPTDKLKLGATVEVYRHDPGGWMAIRPPAGSFTWISARYLDLKKDRLATVNADRLAARVGSRFSDIRDVVQVRLNKGETVEILDSSDGSDENGGRVLWCKISPPAGEFRWIHAKYLDREKPGVGTSKPKAFAAKEKDDEPRHFHGNAEPLVKENESKPQVHPARAEVPMGETALRHFSPEEYQTELDSVELKLSLMAAEEVTAWSFGDLRPRVEKLVETAQTAVERGRAKSIAAKLARFEEIKQRYDSVQSMTSRVDRRQHELDQRARQRAEAIPSGRWNDRYDGIGRLTRVASQSSGAPRFALVDPNGRVRCYISPAPGVSLQGYVGHEVGVNGIRGFIPDQQVHHVMVKHVTLLDEDRQASNN